jgi:hypothetical protein
MSRFRLASVWAAAGLTLAVTAAALAATTSANAGAAKPDLDLHEGIIWESFLVPGSESTLDFGLSYAHAPAENVRVTADFPTGFEIRNVVPSGKEKDQWDCAATTPSKVDCAIKGVLQPDSEPGNSGTGFHVDYVVTDKVREGTAKFQLKVTTSTPEENYRNNRATMSVPVSTTVGSFSGRVWSDTNRNGLQDSGEPGIAGAKVSLWVWSSSEGQRGLSRRATAARVVIPDTITDSDGRYTLTNVPSFTYKVVLDLPGDDPKLTKANAGSNDKIDSDFDTDANAIGTAVSRPYKLRSNGHIVLDAGYLPAS